MHARGKHFSGTAIRALLLLAPIAALGWISPGVTSPEAAFRQLAALEGTWTRSTAKGTVIDLTYELISSGSALLEHFSTSTGRKTLTVYHMDGQNLMMTHYCAQGNQPRLKFVPGEDSTTLQFAFLDATNLPDESASHLVRAELRLVDSTHLEVIEVYKTRMVDGADTLRYARKRSPQ